MKNWVYRIGLGLRTVFLTKRGLTIVLLHTFAFFGTVSAVAQFITALYGSTIIIRPTQIICGTIFLSVLYGLVRAWPRSKISHKFKDIDITVNVVVGDILKHKGQIVIGFSDTFDTDITNNLIINARSLQGQLLTQKFSNNVNDLNAQLDIALKHSTSAGKESRSSKKLGKLKRYKIGTVAVLGAKPDEHIYAVAYTKMGNDLVAESNVNDLWNALGELWESVYINGQREPIALPLIGTGLSRINALDRESLLRMTLLSFVARSREKLICRQLTVYIHSSDRDNINMLELNAFIRAI